MSDRTPEQVVTDRLLEPSAWEEINRSRVFFDHGAVATIGVGALRVEGLLVEPGEVKVRLDGLERLLGEVAQGITGAGPLNDAYVAVTEDVNGRPHAYDKRPPLGRVVRKATS